LDRAWLCWHVDSDWCLVQQCLAKTVGWTPLVGFDPQKGPPERLVEGAVLIDFNANLGLPILYPHVPLEFAFAFIDRLAFWHADFLISPEKLRLYADAFLLLADGETACVPTRQARTILKPRGERYWELLGCTTRAASQSQFDNGCGWWMNFWKHPNFKATGSTKGYSWDHGGGITYWMRNVGGVVKETPLEELEHGHFSIINNPDYKRSTTESAHYYRDLSKELSLNFQLADCARRVGIDLEALLDQHKVFVVNR
jgi:hypothetical protein